MTTDPAVDTAADADVPRAPRHRLGPVWLAAFVGLVVCTNVANALYARWVTGHPLGLIALSSRNRYTAFTAISTDVSFWSWAAVATVRLASAALVCHMIGRVYGDAALRWFWRFLGMTRESVKKFEQQFDVAEIALVPLFVGSNLVFVLSGAARSSWRRLVPLFLIGCLGRLVLIWWLAHEFEGPLRSTVNFLTRYQWWFVIGSIVLVVAVNLRNFRRGRA